jgi:hypothetical protein
MQNPANCCHKMGSRIVSLTPNDRIQGTCLQIWSM